ncbi:hypothetical protein GCM10010517_41490 [Streptosporangium fragile]|uniref:Serine protease n=1 Tax=Streptosporangium fragile TaxID=46186 RepID=A0ABP6IFT5_9ACTN
MYPTAPPPAYQPVAPAEVTAPFSPYPRIAWIWVHFRDPRDGQEWSTSGTGVFLDNDAVLTCAHIFSEGGLNRIAYVEVFPAHNTARPADSGPPDGGVRAEWVQVCEAQLATRDKRDDFSWDFALVCLATPLVFRNVPSFVLEADEYLNQDPAYQGDGSVLRTAGYGGTPGLLTQVNAPVDYADYGAHWFSITRASQPGHSGSPVFHASTDAFKRAEYRLVGVLSCQDASDHGKTLIAMINDRTKNWIERAMSEWSTEKRRRLVRVTALRGRPVGV